MRKHFPTGKQVADTITYARLALAFGLVGLGLVQGRSGLGLGIWVMVADWTGDCLDGPIARRSRVPARTWIGDHDLAVDMVVAIGLLAFLLLAGLVDARMASAYLIAWALLFWRWHVPPVLGMLFQAPIYGWFLVGAIILAPATGAWLLIWILTAIIATWPRFPKVVVPGFLRGMQAIIGWPPAEPSKSRLPHIR